MSSESENKTKVWFTLREFIDYLHENNYRLYCEVLDFVSERVEKERGLFLDPEEGDWGDDGDGRMYVNLTNVDPHPDITASE